MLFRSRSNFNHGGSNPFASPRSHDASDKYKPEHESQHYPINDLSTLALQCKEKSRTRWAMQNLPKRWGVRSIQARTGDGNQVLLRGIELAPSMPPTRISRLQTNWNDRWVKWSCNGEQWDIQHKVRSNASDHGSRKGDEERQIRRTSENRPDRDEQDIADTSTKARVWKIVIGIVFGSYPGCYTHLQCVRKGKGYENKYTSMIENPTKAPNTTIRHWDSKRGQRTIVMTHWGDLYA